MLAWLVAELWGSELVAVHGTVLRPAELPGFIAERSRRVVGLLTYQLVGETLEIVTLNAIERRVVIGTMLIEAAAGTARHFRCREVRLTTTNDNVDALRFYQRRGFRLAELRPGAVDRSRQEKPQIPRSATTASRYTTRSTSRCGSEGPRRRAARAGGRSSLGRSAPAGGPRRRAARAGGRSVPAGRSAPAGGPCRSSRGSLDRRPWPSRPR